MYKYGFAFIVKESDMKIKRITSFVTAALMCACVFTGCSGGGTSSVSSDAPAESTTAPVQELPEVNDEIDTALTPLEFTAGIKVGWNLGNTLDATGVGLGSERAWGNPTTTEQMILTVKDAGFNAVRIPTTWEGHMDESYNIDPEWMARVTEVVDYAYKNDMYVILNMHHEEWYYPDNAHKDSASAQLEACWTQIAENFSGYDERLIFEGMNEPRWKNTQWEWNGGNDEGREVVNHLNQVFVDAVRATGGNNAERFLMVCPYAANSSESALAALKLPEDDRLIVSVHAYIPYGFALQDKGTHLWIEEKAASTNDIDVLAEVLNRLFISKGTAVIIGETGAMSRFYESIPEGGTKEDSITKTNDEYRSAWAEYYFGTFRELGIPCFWWDNGAFLSGETFGMLKRSECEWRYPDVVDGIMKGAGVK